MGVAALAAAAIGASVVQGVVGYEGAKAEAKAQSQAAAYNSQVALNNASVAAQNARLAGEAGQVQVANQELKARAALGNIKANQGASGVDVNSGSSVDTRISADEVAQQDALNIRANAAKEAYGYQTQKQSYESEAGLKKYESEADLKAGQIQADTTLLGGLGQAGSSWASFKMAGAL